MAAVDALTEPQTKEAIATLDDELSVIFDERDVPAWLQGRIAFVGCRKLGTFGRIEATDKDVRSWMINQLKVDPDADPGNRTAMATVVDAWQASKRRLDRRDEVEAEERASKMPKTIPQKDFYRMKASYAKTYLENKALEDYETPHLQGFESSCEQIEDGQIKAELLKDVVSEKEAEGGPEDSWTPIYQADGSMKLRAKKNQVPPPSEPEGFRYRMRLLSVKWVMLSDKFPNNARLKGLQPKTFNEHAEYILGPEVKGLDARDASGASIAKPTWATLMSYELEVRKKAFRRFNEEGVSLAEALKHARDDSSLRERFLQIPFSITAAAIAAAGNRFQPPQPNLRQRQQPANAKRGKVTRTAAQKERKWQDANGARICKSFQRDSCYGECGRLHICDYCLGDDHSFARCPHILPPTQPPAGQQQAQKGGGWKGQQKGWGKGYSKGWHKGYGKQGWGKGQGKW